MTVHPVPKSVLHWLPFNFAAYYDSFDYLAYEVLPPGLYYSRLQSSPLTTVQIFLNHWIIAISSLTHCSTVL